MDWPISDIAAIDIDGDGELEYATIEPFHGSYFRVYKLIDGASRQVYEHPEVSEFYHVVVGTTLAGQAGVHRRLPAREAATVLRARAAEPARWCFRRKSSKRRSARATCT